MEPQIRLVRLGRECLPAFLLEIEWHGYLFSPSLIVS